MLKKIKMRDELKIMTFVFLLVLGISFFIFNHQGGPTLQGYAISEEVSFENNTLITEDFVIKEINESENIINEMENSNFSVDEMKDLLLDAKIVLEEARYAAILRGEINASEEEIAKARSILRAKHDRKITYEDVLIYTNEIKAIKYKILVLYDELIIKQSELESFDASENVRDFLFSAQLAFNEGRYDECAGLLEEFELALEAEKEESSRLNVLRKSALTFFEKNWIYILITLVILGLISYFIYKLYKARKLENKIKKMEAEKGVLLKLIKKAQEDRFVKDNISENVYKIRINKYRKRLQEIKQELPVLKKKVN